MAAKGKPHPSPFGKYGKHGMWGPHSKHKSKGMGKAFHPRGASKSRFM